ncbi:MAG: hypothetical protein HRU19_06290 [Pseudobacteriovorax sp.]|nr:hypothetical protein [Pseudobacteriovorax sp.]
MHKFTLFLLAMGFQSAMAQTDIDPEMDFDQPSTTLNTRWEAQLSLQMTPKGFGSRVTLLQYISPYFQFGQDIRYFRQEEKEAANREELSYGGDFHMRITPFSAYKFSPFLLGFGGLAGWRAENEVFQSPIAGFAGGLNIYLTEFFVLTVVQRETYFTDTPPEFYWGIKTENDKVSQNQVMLSFRFENSMLF